MNGRDEDCSLNIIIIKILKSLLILVPTYLIALCSRRVTLEKIFIIKTIEQIFEIVQFF